MKTLSLTLVAFLLAACNPVSPSETRNNEVPDLRSDSPVCAAYQVQCVTTPCPPIPTTYTSREKADQAGAEFLYEGACVADLPIPEADLEVGNFNFNAAGNFMGELYVRGYIMMQDIPEPFCEEDCETYQGVMLNVMATGNPDFQTFLEENRDNAYVRPASEAALGSLMIGCRDGNDLYWSNDSDEFGMANRRLEDTAILNQLPPKLAKFKLTKLELSGGRGAPACYSHFYDIELLD